MSPERTTPTAPAAAAPPRGAAKETPAAGGFAELLDAAAETAAPARDELISDSEINSPHTTEIPFAIVPGTAPVAQPVPDPAPDPATEPSLDAVFEPVAAPGAPDVVSSPVAIPMAVAAGDVPESVAPTPAPVSIAPTPVPGPIAPSPVPDPVAMPAVAAAVPVSKSVELPAAAPAVVVPGSAPDSVEIPAAAAAVPASDPVPKSVEIPAPAGPAPDADALPPADAPPPADPARAAASPADAKPQPPLVVDRPPAPHRAAPLHEAPRAVAQLLQLAVDRDISRAKLNLRPAELGGVEIRLQTSAAGVTAQVVADSPAAAALLSQAADDLRRSLERHDVTLLSLDVSTSGDGRPHHGGDRRDANQPHPDEPQATPTTVRLPDGLLVDVLA